MRRDLEKKSRFMSYILRHEPESIGLELDAEGWVDIDELLAKANGAGTELTRSELDDVVRDSDNNRFEISEDWRRIRATFGHSTEKVAITRNAETPPDVLYHGTTQRFLASIMEQGLVAGERHHVHLGVDPVVAAEKGRRYGKPVVLRVDARGMQAQGMAFYPAANGAWLTDHVPVAFLSVVEDPSA